MLSAVKNYFAITKKEWNGMLFLAALILIVLLAPDVYQLFKEQKQVDFSRIKEAQKVLADATEEQPAYDRKYDKADYSKHASFN